MRFVLLIIVMALTPSLSAQLPIDCGIYTFYGRLREGREGLLYLSSNSGTLSQFEILVVGIPRDQIHSAYVGIRFYNPKSITTSISNNSVVFMAWEKGDAEHLNETSGETRPLEPSAFRWPKLRAHEDCNKGVEYFRKMNYKQ